MCKVSIIVPIYNIDKEFLDKCIKSLVNQTLKDIEIILIDDGSNNNCAKLCDEYSRIDKRIICIHQENLGVSVARNRGIKEANSDWIMFVDPDDWIDYDTLEKIDSYLNNDVDVLTFFYYDSFKNFEKKQIPEFKQPYIIEKNDYIKLIKGLINPYELFINGYFGAVWCNVFKKEFLEKNELLFNDKLRKSQDTLFNLNLLIKYPKMIFIPISLYHYRHQSDSICHKYNRDAKIILKNLIDEIKTFLIENSLFNICKESFYMRCIITINEAIDIYFFNKNYDCNWKTCKNELNKFIYQNDLINSLEWGKTQNISIKIKIKCYMILYFKRLMFIYTRIKNFKNKKNIY